MAIARGGPTRIRSESVALVKEYTTWGTHGSAPHRGTFFVRSDGYDGVGYDGVVGSGYNGVEGSSVKTNGRGHSYIS